MNDFVENVIAADAKYFIDHYFISEDQYNRAINWREGVDDPEIQTLIADWLESDVRYIDEVKRSVLKQMWYVAPVIETVLTKLKSQLMDTAKVLTGG